MSCICSFNLNENSERVFMVCPESMELSPTCLGVGLWRKEVRHRWVVSLLRNGICYFAFASLASIYLHRDIRTTRVVYELKAIFAWNRIPTKQKRLLQLSNKYKCIRSVHMVMQRDATVYFSAETQTPYVRGVIGGVFVFSRWGCVSVVRRGFTFPGGSVEKSLTHVVQMHFMKEEYTVRGWSAGRKLGNPISMYANIESMQIDQIIKRLAVWPGARSFPLRSGNCWINAEKHYIRPYWIVYG